jgi:exopolysaccharide biosynthesis polyprenyl glycosylphosphotransferase
MDTRIARELPHGQRHVLVLGAGALARRTTEALSVAGRCTIGVAALAPDATEHDLAAIALAHAVDEVFIAADARVDGDAMDAAIRACEILGLPFALPAQCLRVGRARMRDAAAARDGYLHYVHAEPKPVQTWLKRAIDIVLALLALLLIAPVLAVAAIAIKLTSRGPVLFTQERVGHRGRTFKMLKLRSMVVDAEAIKASLMAFNEQSGPVFKMTRDPRITTVGRLLRKYSIDELPQLVNVLRGEMSIVGPRPPLPSEVAQYEPWQRRRLSVTPGLTCIWQVSGRNAIGFDDWMKLDLEYIDHWSLAFDAWLVLRTVPIVLLGRGAS